MTNTRTDKIDAKFNLILTDISNHTYDNRQHWRHKKYMKNSQFMKKNLLDLKKSLLLIRDRPKNIKNIIMYRELFYQDKFKLPVSSPDK